MTMLNAPDTIRGNAGTAVANINGTIVELFYLSKFEMKADVEDIEIVSIGAMVKGHKKGLINISGTIEMYDMTSDFIDLLDSYKKTGKFPYFSILGTNDDPESNAGRKRVRFTGVSFNEMPLQLIDNAAGVIKASFAVVANDYEILEKFSSVN